MLWILLIITVLALFYIRLKQKNKYWSNLGIRQGSPMLIFGDQWRAVAHHESLSEMIQRLYNIGPNERYSGAYDFMSPALVLKDPDLIKDVLVKDFDHFVDHKRVIPEGSDPIWDHNLFFLTGQKWRDMRSAVSPVFTGSKMRQMFVNFSKTAQRFVEHFMKVDQDVISVEVKDTFARLTNDIIAATVFGFESDSLGDPNSKFYEMTNKITDFRGFWQGIRMLGFFIFPTLYKACNIRILSSELANFFYQITKDNIRARKEQKITRPDVINLLMEARDNQKLIHGVQITDEDITAQAIVFLFAGLDTVSSLMCFMSYELALNPDIQKRLIEEIDSTAEACDNALTYEDVQNMKYLDMVVLESLRKWSITPFVSRICTNPYTIAPKRPNEKPIHLKKNDILFLPIYALHHDPKHFPEPNRFDPDRFSPENKSKITPYTFVPFGEGPRKCIGYRFALLETKVLFFYLLSKFELVTTEKTEIPVKIRKMSINMTPDTGLWLGLKRRT